MKLFLTILFCSFYFYGSSNLDSTYFEEKNNNLELDNQELRALLVDQDKRINKLEIEAKYYQNTLSGQTTIYSLVTAGILAIVGFITFSKIRSEVESYKSQSDRSLKKQKEKFDDFNKTAQETEEKLLHQSAGISMLVCQINIDEAPHVSFDYALQAASSAIRIDKNSSRTLTAIKMARDLLDEMIRKEMNKTDLSLIKEKALLSLRHLNSCDSADINEISSEITYKLNNYVK